MDALSGLWVDYLAAPIPVIVGIGLVAALALIGFFTLVASGWSAFDWWLWRRFVKAAIKREQQQGVRVVRYPGREGHARSTESRENRTA